MTDLEISKALALAIGYREHDHVFCPAGMCLVYTGKPHDKVLAGKHWVYNHRIFDYRDWSVAGPIAQRYNKFPYMHKSLTGVPDGKWVVYPDTLEDTPQKAIAMAVINGDSE